MFSKFGNIVSMTGCILVNKAFKYNIQLSIDVCNKFKALNMQVPFFRNLCISIFFIKSRNKTNKGMFLVKNCIIWFI